ncbi:MAG TPA: retropepsin-like aspartic protease [Alphaproteobacteria bacterium]|nr:retropepsin-like aspartic protease [Alphaproteobacteria bacterium]
MEIPSNINKNFSLSFKHFVITAVGSVLLIVCPLSRAELYSYVDENGTRTFVSKIEDIPEQYREQINTIKGKYDDLSSSQKQAMMDAEKAKSTLKAEEWKKQQLEAAEQRRKDEEEKKRIEEEKKDQKVNIDKDKVLIPTTICFSNKTKNISLVMDTGAAMTLIHKNIADEIGIDLSQFKKYKLSVVGGETKDGFLGIVDYITVGPIKRKREMIMVTEYTGKEDAGYDGLLGMNFLKHYKYDVDFEKQTVLWLTKSGEPIKSNDDE